MTTEQKTWVVYKVNFGMTMYLVEVEAPGSYYWSSDTRNAKRMTHTQAHRLWKKMKKGLDYGSPNPYGFGQVP